MGDPLLVNSRVICPVPEPTYLAAKAIEMPVIVASAGTLKLMVLAWSLADEPAVTVATVVPVPVILPGLVQGVPDPELAADPGTIEVLVGVPVATEAYAVLLKMLLGEFQDGPVARLPMFGPA